MKTFGLLAIVVSLFSTSVYADIEARPLLGVGARFGDGSSADRATAGYFSGKLNWIRFGNYDSFCLLSPGIGIQTDGRFHGSIAPFVYSMNSGISIGFDIILPDNSEQNIFGVFLGYEFLP